MSTVEPAGPNGSEVILVCMDEHPAHYRRADGSETAELANFNDSSQPRNGLYARR